MRGATAWLGWISILSATVGCTGVVESSESVGTTEDAIDPARDHAGVAESFHITGTIDRTNPFFRVFGTNGRACATCHDSRADWTMTPKLARAIFRESEGLAPLFRPVDETVRPDADVSTLEAREKAYAMLLTKGVTRFTRTIKPTAEFEVIAVDDPYGWSTPAAFSNFRRIPSSANAAHETTITWTGAPNTPVRTALMNLMVGGTKFHGETTFTVSPTDAAAGADFLLGLSFAQSIDRHAGRLDVAGATGGPANLSAEPFHIGINALGGDPVTGTPFDNESFDLYDAWELEGSGSSPRTGPSETSDREARERIGRGEHAFYTIDIEIRGVPGLNDALGQEVVHGHCTTCHNTPNIGSSSEYRLIDLGVAAPERRTRDIPLLTLRNKTTGEIRRTTEVGRAISTGLWADLAKVKVPTLRGVGVRAPYFHNGSADSLEDVLEFYEHRFHVDFHGSKDDIIAFLKAL
jgi:hypothetical protein